MLARLTILNKILVPTAIMIAVGIGIILYSMASLSRMDEMMKESIEQHTNRLVATLEIQEAMYSAADKEKAAILSSDAAAVKESADAIAEELKTANDSADELETLAKNSTDAADGAKVDEMKAAIKGYTDTVAKIIELAAANQDDQALALARGEGADFRKKVDDLGDEIRGKEDTALEQSQASADELSSSTKQRLVAGSLVGLAIAAALMLWIVMLHVSRPITAMASSMLKIAGGDNTIEVRGTDRADEVGGMARALQVFKTNAIEKQRLEAEAAAKLAEERAREEAVQRAERQVQQEMASLIDAAAAGDLTRRIDLAGKDGLMLKLGEGMNRWAETVNAILGEVIQMMAALAQGDLTKRIEGNYRGDLARLKNDSNATADQLAAIAKAERSFQEDLAALVDAAAAGEFSRRVDLDGKNGLMLKLGEGMNRFAETVSQALQQVVDVMSALARGDLTKRIEGDYRGDLMRLKTDTNATADKLAAVVGQVVDGMTTIKTATAQLAVGATDLSARTEEQVASLEEMAASIRQVSVTVKQNADNAQQANQLALAARTAAENGGTVTNSAVEAVGQIQESSQRIAEIVSMIDEIAFQTNLLALNAAVEAARAGEAGRGFAVVAAEVRALAQRSSEASKEIKGLIASSGKHVERGVGLVNNAGQKLTEIVTSVKRVADIVSEIAAASQEQAGGVQQVDEAVTQMEGVTQKNAALVEESTTSLTSVDQQVEELMQLVDFFQTGGEAKARPESHRPKARELQENLAARVEKQADKAAPRPAAAEPAQPPRQRTAWSGGTGPAWDKF